MTKIVGNVVGIPNPQPDWHQTDPTKADYIKNKPDSIGGGVKELNPDVDFNKILENGIYVGLAVYEVTQNVPSKIYTEEQIEEQQELGGKASTQYTMLVSMSDKDEEGFQSGFQAMWSYPWYGTKPFVICRFADINMNDSFVDWTEWFDISGGSVDVDLSDYVKKEYDRGLSTISNITFPWHYEDNADGTENEYIGIDVEYFDDDDENWHDEFHLYTKEHMDKKLSELKPSIIDGSEGLDKFYEPGSYSVRILSLDSIGTIYGADNEVIDLTHRKLQIGMASLKVSPYQTFELGNGGTGKSGSTQELTLNYWYDDENGDYIEGSCVLVRMLDQDSNDGSFMYYGWHVVADSLGMGGSVDVDLSEYYTSDDVDSLLRSKVDKVSGRGLSQLLRADTALETAENGSYGHPFQWLEIWNQTDLDPIISIDFYNPSQVNNLLDKKADLSYAQTIEAIAKGRATGYVFDTYEDMTEWLLDTANIDTLKKGDNLYIRALDVPDYWWDGSSAQQLETQKVDLTEYVEKEENKGLSDASRISVAGWWDDDEISGYEELEIQYHDGTEHSSEFYNREQMRQRLGLKQDKIKTDIVVEEDVDGNLVLELTNNSETYIGMVSQPLKLTLAEDRDKGFESYFTFYTLNTEIPAVTVNCNNMTDVVDFIGDDCNAEGVFTPSVNSKYEVSVKFVDEREDAITDEAGETITATRKHFVARVGAC